MKIRPVGAELFHAEKQPDGLTEMMKHFYERAKHAFLSRFPFWSLTLNGQCFVVHQ
jgi:hypothetical protein